MNRFNTETYAVLQCTEIKRKRGKTPLLFGICETLQKILRTVE